MRTNAASCAVLIGPQARDCSLTDDSARDRSGPVSFSGDPEPVTYSPDSGTLTVYRPSGICDAREIVCPKCAQVIRRFTAGEGSSVVLCDNKLKVGVGQQRVGDRCGQHIFAAGDSTGFATVFPITKREYEGMLAGGGIPGKRAVLELLGVLRPSSRRAG